MGTNARYDLICFDVDGTLIRHPTDKVIWEILNLRFTGDDRVNVERYRQYRAGELSYDEWVQLDVSGWIAVGATRDRITQAVREFEVVEGAMETVWALKERGAQLAVVSGTLDVVIDTLFPDHPFDDVYTNRLHFDGDGRLAGWTATPYDIHGKPEAVRNLAERHGIPLERCAFVGDGENDVPLVGVVGCLIAFNPRSRELEAGADHVLKGESMKRILEIL